MMAARGVYGCSDMAALLKKEEFSSLALIASSSSSSNYIGFDGSRSILNFEGDCDNAMNQPYYGQVDAEENGDDDLDVCLQQPEKKRRLTADKVKCLEKSFELENKLEPERKIQLAKDLSLQPRQVAIWFQNRRARWKTKQLEKDYEALKSGYNVLKVDCENLQKDNEKLKAEVSFLTDLEEKEKGMTKATQLKILENEVVGAKESKMQVLEVKHEDLNSTNSAILNSADSNAFDHDHSDLSHVDEDEEEKGYHLFEDNPDSFAFPVEDQAFWFWP